LFDLPGDVSGGRGGGGGPTCLNRTTWFRVRWEFIASPLFLRIFDRINGQFPDRLVWPVVDAAYEMMYIDNDKIYMFLSDNQD